MFTEFSILQRLHSDVEHKLMVDAFNYNHFRGAWYSFLNLLDIVYPESYSCRHCGAEPTSLIMDATSVSFRQALDSWRSFVGDITTTRKKSGR